MSANISISGFDQAAFEAKLRQYSEHSKKDFAQICNDKGLDLAIKAGMQTEKASADEIRATLNADSLAYKIVKKKTGLSGSELKAAKEKFIAAKVRAINFTKSCWFKAGDKMKSFASGKSVPKLKISSPHTKARIEPAKAGLRPQSVVVAQYEAPIAADVGLEGLQKAGPLAIADMDKYIERKLKERAAKL